MFKVGPDFALRFIDELSVLLSGVLIPHRIHTAGYE
jgi:hypothetical protein